ncbi:MAG: hypothetical protein ACXVK4_14730 [Acidimicrobiia bacterium]
MRRVLTLWSAIAAVTLVADLVWTGRAVSLDPARLDALLGPIQLPLPFDPFELATTRAAS